MALDPDTKPNMARIKDKVYDYERANDGRQANGYVKDIDYEEKELIVKFYDVGDPEEIPFSRAIYSTDFGGIWYLI